MIETVVLNRFFIALLMLLSSTYFFGYLFNRFKLPRVVGEIFGGLVLGPTFLGYIYPNIFETVFLKQAVLLDIMYWFGLILLMFSSGFEIERKFSLHDKKSIFVLIGGTTIIPLILGWFAIGFFNMETIVGTANNILSLKLIMITALAITSIPVLSKIFLDMGIIQTPFAKITLATATAHDIILWVLISVATGLVTSNMMSITDVFLHIIVTILFFIVALIVAPKIIKFIGHLKFRLVPINNETAFIVLILLVFITLSSFLNVNLIFGAFLAGIVVNYINSSRFQGSKQYVKNFSMAFFVPIYFALVGIKIDLIHHFDPLFFIEFTIFATVIMGFSVLLSARILKYDWLSGLNLASALNNKGGPGIVLATLAFDLGIINETFFVTLILLAIITSVVSGCWLRYVLSKGYPLLKQF